MKCTKHGVKKMETLLQKWDLEDCLTACKTDSNHLERINGLLEEVQLGIEGTVKERLLEEKARLLFPRIDLSFLSMKHADKVIIKCEEAIKDYNPFGYAHHPLYRVLITIPRFAIYTLENPVFEITGRFKINYYSYIDESPSIKFQEELSNVIVAEVSKSVSFQLKKTNTKSVSDTIEEADYSFSIWTNFEAGVIPESVKRNIEEAKKIFGEDIYIISESGNWKVAEEGIRLPQRTSGTSSPDPLLIGVKNENCYLIDQFDCTPMEDYVRREFSI